MILDGEMITRLTRRMIANKHNMEYTNTGFWRQPNKRDDSVSPARLLDEQSDLVVTLMKVSTELHYALQHAVEEFDKCEVGCCKQNKDTINTALGKTFLPFPEETKSVIRW